MRTPLEVPEYDQPVPALARDETLTVYRWLREQPTGPFADALLDERMSQVAGKLADSLAQAQPTS